MINLPDISNDHLLNIQRFLKRRLRNKRGIAEIAWSQAYAYDCFASDREWYTGDAYVDIDENIEKMIGNYRIALMKISQEVSLRNLIPLGL